MSEYISDELRTAVRQRAAGRCEYCLFPQQETLLPLEVDHIIALKHGGLTILENLALACPTCNIQEGTDLASIDSTTGKICRLFHPRNDSWNDHFQIQREFIVPLTPIGRVTEFLLKF